MRINPLLRLYGIDSYEVEGNELERYAGGLYGGGQEKIGDGPAYYELDYSFKLTLISLFLTLGGFLLIGIKSYKQINKHMNSYEVESIL